MGNCFTPPVIPYATPQPIQINFVPCAPVNLTPYGLENALLTLTSTLISGTQNYTITLSFNTVPVPLPAPPIPVTTKTVVLTVNPAVSVNLVANNTQGLVTIEGKQVTISFFAPGQPPLLFIFNFDSVTDGIRPDFVLGNTNGFSLPAPNSVPNVTARARPSPDGRQICELDFTVTLQGSSLNCVQKSVYKQYCLDFASVIRCPEKCTLRQALDCLIACGRLTDSNDFLQYMILRYILSGLVFGQFSVQYLRQRYNEQFLTLVSMPPYEAFLPSLQEGTQYVSLFQC